MRRTVASIFAALAFVGACSGGGSTAPASNTGGNNNGGTGGSTSVPPNTVIARAFDSFDPSSLTVAVNTSVSFTFESTTHNVTFDIVNGRPADIGNNSNTT